MQPPASPICILSKKIHNSITAINFTAVTKSVAVEVKRQRKAFNAKLFAEKVQHLKEKVLPGYDIEQRCLTLEEM